MSNNLKKILILLVIVITTTTLFFTLRSKTSPQEPTGQIKIVAAENFWGSLVSQIGGNKVQVLSIVSDPNADPHEYESNDTDAKAMANANYVILNGAGYDSWANKLIDADPNSNRVVLNVADLVGVAAGGNPHIWYNPAYVNTTIKQMAANLEQIDPKNKGYYQKQLTNLQTNLEPYQSRIASIKKHYSGMKVAATEDIFAYLADASGLDLVSPPAFTQAVAEGNDPPTGSVVDFQQQLQSGQINLLVYNEQTVTPLTSSMKVLAAQQNIPIVGVTETIQPPDTSFQDWMNSQLINIENGLNSKQLGQ